MRSARSRAARSGRAAASPSPRSGTSDAAGLAVGRSDAARWSAECGRLLSLAELESRRGRETDEHFRGALKACETALTAVPAHAPALDASSRVEWRWADSLSGRRETRRSREAYVRPVALAERAVAGDPARTSAHANPGIALWGVAQVAASAGEDPRPFLEPAARAMREPKRLEPATAVTSNLGSLRFEKAIELNAKNANPRNNLGELWLLLSRDAFARDRDAGELLANASSSFASALELNPRLTEAVRGQSAVLVLRARVRARRGEDPAAELAQARASSRQAADGRMRR